MWLCAGDHHSGNVGPFNTTYSNNVLLNAANRHMSLYIQLCLPKVSRYHRKELWERCYFEKSYSTWMGDYQSRRSRVRYYPNNSVVLPLAFICHGHPVKNLHVIPRLLVVSCQNYKLQHLFHSHNVSRIFINSSNLFKI